MTEQTPLAIVILAAGKGTRMKSALPKVMHKIAGRPMINWLIEAAEALEPEKIIVVTGPDMPDLKAAAAPHSCVIQQEQKGTGDAVKPAMKLLEGFDGKVLILLGDEPFVDLTVLEEMIAHDGISVMAVEQDFPSGLGRVFLKDDGTLEHIVEAKDCTEEQLDHPIRNAGNFCVPAKHLAKWLDQIKNDNKQNEYYLTDLPKIAEQDGFATRVIGAEALGGWGINTRAELAEHEFIAQDMLRQMAMEEGVTMIDPDTVTLSWDTQFGQDVIIEPNVYIGPWTSIESGVTIHAFSHIEGAIIEEGAEIGPFARIRPKSVIGEGASVGNFTEINRSTLEAGAKAKHVSYIGDTIVGSKANIGAGTIIANYDGFFKHQSRIGKDVFVGSNSTIISPVVVGDGAIIAAGSNVNKDIPANAMAIGRSRQENHLGWASEYRKVKQQQKHHEEE
ncbi:MAG TPA: bifunctional UDP-N-acetylglucosamine diphosphorylase/glucosamine-1-phosphate N-acetyltransferase GlmU [Alphaproteobacteria bacterium]|nr:bifunctional UDP-N-acetylglucosamine diphosphorylase/glucosamine-1-phosphate N-acetyltransferase GlmU [Alphaproteobacteria bacterium]